MPPFQNTDEINHFLRATQIAEGGFVGYRFTHPASNGAHVSAGGFADPAIMAAVTPFEGIQFHTERRVTAAEWAAANVRWSDKRTLIDFPNTALYPPFFYLPAALGVRVGQAFNLKILQSLTLSRALTGAATAALGALAIAIAGAASVWLFAILTLPMSLALMTSPAPDGLMLAFSALAGALMVRIMHRPQAPTTLTLVGLTGSLTLVVMARQPFAALAILLFELKDLRWRWRMLAALTVVACTLLWSAFAAAMAWTNFAASVGADPAAQLAHVLQHPLMMGQVAVTTMRHYFSYYVEQFVGRLGWLDTELPPFYHAAVWAILCLAAVATIVGSNVRRSSAHGGFIALGLLFSAGGLFVFQYFVWTRARQRDL